MRTKPLLSSALLFGCASFLALTLASAPSYAAFQWVAPESPVGIEAPVKPTPAPDFPVEPKIIQAPSVTPAADDPNFTKESDLVLGFADEVPLAVALRQVLPKNVGFSVAQNVSLGTLVSWQGGTSWRVVLADMLRPVNLEAKEVGNMVHVLASGSFGQVAPAAPAVTEEKAKQALPENKPVNLTTTAQNTLAPPPLETKKIEKAPFGEHYLVPPARVTTGSPVSLSSKPVESSAPVSLLSSDSDSDSLSGEWKAKEGETLREVLKKWAYRANVDLSWQAEYDYPLQASVSLAGSFEDAVRQLLVGFQNAEPQPYGDMHSNQVAGQMVLVIKARGNKNSD